MRVRAARTARQAGEQRAAGDTEAGLARARRATHLRAAAAAAAAAARSSASSRASPPARCWAPTASAPLSRSCASSARLLRHTHRQHVRIKDKPVHERGFDRRVTPSSARPSGHVTPRTCHTSHVSHITRVTHHTCHHTAPHVSLSSASCWSRASQPATASYSSRSASRYCRSTACDVPHRTTPHDTHTRACGLCWGPGVAVACCAGPQSCHGSAARAPAYTHTRQRV
jgi:hypothetical protein